MKAYPMIMDNFMNMKILLITKWARISFSPNETSVKALNWLKKTLHDQAEQWLGSTFWYLLLSLLQLFTNYC